MPSKTKQTPLFTFGVIADIQYADIDDAANFSGSEIRHYRDALNGARVAVEFFDEKKPDFVLQLGDIIDGQNAGEYGALVGKPIETESAFKSVIDVLNSGRQPMKYYHSIGNHELYNFNWSQLKNKLNTRCSHIQHQISDKETGNFYFSIKPCEGWRIIQLNPFQVSTMLDPADPGFQEAKRVIVNNNPNHPKIFDGDKVLQAVTDYGEGLQGVELRFLPFNGGIGEEQLLWLERELSTAHSKNEKVILTTHVPLEHRAANYRCIVYDYEKIMHTFKRFNPCPVKLVLAGHSHRGGYFHDKTLDLTHITIQSPLVFKQSHGLFSIYNDRIELLGVGGLPSRTISLQSLNSL